MTDAEAANWCEDFGRVAWTVDGQEALRRAVAALRVKGMLVEALEELIGIVEGIRTDGDKPDSFTCQPARAALAEARKEPS